MKNFVEQRSYFVPDGTWLKFANIFYQHYVPTGQSDVHTAARNTIVVTTLPAVLPLIRLVLNEVGGSDATVVHNYGSLNSSFVRSQPVPYGSDLPIANGCWAPRARA